MKLATVIIPTYNRADLLIRALDSVRMQTYRPIEVIVVDDGSTDNTQMLVEQWCEQNTDESWDIYYFRKQNGGPSSCRNLGLSYAKGDFIYFLDSDDYMHPNLFKEAIEVLDREESDCVIFGFSFERNDGCLGSYFPPKNKPAIEAFLVGSLWGYTSCILSRADLIDKVGYWNEDIRLSEDYEFLGRTLLSSRKTSILYDRLLTVMLGHESLTSLKNSKKGLNDRLQAEGTIVNLLVEHDGISNVLLTKYASRLYKTAINMYAKKEMEFAKEVGILAKQIDRGPWNLIDRSKRFVWKHGKLLSPFWNNSVKIYSSVRKWIELKKTAMKG